MLGNRSSGVLCLWCLVALQLVTRGQGISLGDLFNSSDKDAQDYNVTSVEDYGPVMVKTMQALQYTKAAPGAATGQGNELVVPYGTASRAIVRRDSRNSLYVSFDDVEVVNTTANWATNTTRVPFLQNLVYTAEAPAALVATFSQLAGAGANTAGPLTDAVQKVMAGERILWVTCTGEGSGGGLAYLCGLASALYFPGTSVDVITFATPWQGFNPQFSWAFDRLISLYYLWPFNSSSTTPPTAADAAAEPTAVRQFAQGLETLITAPGTLAAAVNIPNLPPALPKGATEIKESNVRNPPGTYDENVKACEDSFANQTYGYTPTCLAGSPVVVDLGPWAPAQTLGPQFLPPCSPCPPIVCRSVPYLDMSCTAFDTAGNTTVPGTPGPPALGGLPFTRVQDARSGGDAIVAWNETSKEAIFLFKFTNETRDWVADALAYRTDDFRKKIDEDFPASQDITAATGDPQVHAGFYSQFESLLVEGEGEGNLKLTTALNRLNNGQDPLFIAISGFSLGGALSELAAVWSSYKWPRAHILVATQGAPKVGNEDFVTLYKSTAGVAWRFQFNLDEVPSTPPLAGYRTTRQPIWITGAGGAPWNVLLQVRPEVALGVTTWYDHWCQVFYVPILKNATAVAVPSWVYNATAP